MYWELRFIGIEKNGY
jgi:hypothetical protein